jgi:hypothetical protein
MFTLEPWPIIILLAPLEITLHFIPTPATPTSAMHKNSPLSVPSVDAPPVPIQHLLRPRKQPCSQDKAISRR